MCRDFYVSDLDEWVSEMPNQIKVVFTEEFVHNLYDTVSRETADRYIICLLRYLIYGEEPYNATNGVETEEMLFNLMLEKVGCFGSTMYGVYENGGDGNGK